jgi:hypothetical protein
MSGSAPDREQLTADLEKALDLVRALDAELPPNLDFSAESCLTAVRKLDQGPDMRICVLNLYLDRLLAHGRSLTRRDHLSSDVRADAYDLVATLKRAKQIARQFTAGFPDSLMIADEPTWVELPIRASRLAGQLADVAARLLPQADRPRYAEEFRGELYELARVSRSAQWAYAGRQLVRCIPLRRELRRDAREAAGG